MMIRFKYPILISGLFIFVFLTLYIGCKKDDQDDPFEPPVYTNGEGEIGPNGGTVKIEDPASPLDGVSVVIPEGALTGPVTISISQAPDDIKIQDDTTLRFVEFSPAGLTFEKPVTISLRIPEKFNKLTASIINYDPQNYIVEHLNTTKTSEDIIYAETGHFSYYTVSQGNLITNFEMLNINGKIGVNLNVGYISNNQNIGLEGITTLLSHQVATGNFNVWQTVQDQNFSSLKFIARADLYEATTFSGDLKASILLAPDRHPNTPGDYKLDLWFNNESDPVFNDPFLYGCKWCDVEVWMTGMPLIYQFNFIPDPDKKYYVKVAWEFNYGEIGNFLTRITSTYEFNNRPDRRKVSEMTNFNKDADNNYVDDDYQDPSQSKPLVQTGPFSKVISGGATLQGELIHLGQGNFIQHGHCWSLTGIPDANDSKTSLGKATTTGEYESVISGLQNGSRYYYRAYAINEHGIAYGAVQSFLASNNPPNDPVIVSPLYAATNVPLNVVFKWSCSDPDNDELTYFFALYDWTGVNILAEATLNVTEYSTNLLEYGNSYVWNVMATDGNFYSDLLYGYFETTDGNSGTNHPPNTPQLIYPTSFINISPNNVIFQWDCSDPDNDPLTYDLYVGLYAPTMNKIATGITSKSYQYDGLEAMQFYVWKIVAKDNHGYSATSSVGGFLTYNVGSPPTASFTASPTSGNAPLAVAFTDQSTGDPTGWSWDFGDGGTSTQQNPSYTYQAPGNYTVQLTVSNNNGSDDEIKTNYIIVSEAGNAPIAAFTGTPTSGTAPLTVNFTDQSANGPTSWQWDFGDGNSSNEQNPMHIYSAEGYYTIELTVTNANGSDHETKNNYILVTSGGGGGGEPCPGIPTITYEGQVYNTVLIGSQCWLKENLNVGTMIPGIQEMSDNGIIEKYCHDNNPANCAVYGGLYQWDEMMQYIITEGTQGICPDGWHIPTDSEWTILSDFLGGEEVAGGKMKEAGYAHWRAPNIGATNESGFTALPGGSRYYTGGGLYGLGSFGLWWSSTEELNSSLVWDRILDDNSTNVHREYFDKTTGSSLRCLKD